MAHITVQQREMFYDLAVGALSAIMTNYTGKTYQTHQELVIAYLQLESSQQRRVHKMIDLKQITNTVNALEGVPLTFYKSRKIFISCLQYYLPQLSIEEVDQMKQSLCKQAAALNLHLQEGKVFEELRRKILQDTLNMHDGLFARIMVYRQLMAALKAWLQEMRDPQSNDSGLIESKSYDNVHNQKEDDSKSKDVQNQVTQNNPSENGNLEIVVSQYNLTDLQHEILKLGVEMDPETGKVRYSEEEIAARLGVNKGRVQYVTTKVRDKYPQYRRYSYGNVAITRNYLPSSDWKLLDQLYEAHPDLDVPHFQQYIRTRAKAIKQNEQHEQTSDDVLIMQMSKIPNLFQVGFWYDTKQLKQQKNPQTILSKTSHQYLLDADMKHDQQDVDDKASQQKQDNKKPKHKTDGALEREDTSHTDSEAISNENRSKKDGKDIKVDTKISSEINIDQDSTNSRQIDIEPKIGIKIQEKMNPNINIDTIDNQQNEKQKNEEKTSNDSSDYKVTLHNKSDLNLQKLRINEAKLQQNKDNILNTTDNIDTKILSQQKPVEDSRKEQLDTDFQTICQQVSIKQFALIDDIFNKIRQHRQLSSKILNYISIITKMKIQHVRKVADYLGKKQLVQQQENISRHKYKRIIDNCIIVQHKFNETQLIETICNVKNIDPISQLPIFSASDISAMFGISQNAAEFAILKTQYNNSKNQSDDNKSNDKEQTQKSKTEETSGDYYYEYYYYSSYYTGYDTEDSVQGKTIDDIISVNNQKQNDSNKIITYNSDDYQRVVELGGKLDPETGRVMYTEDEISKRLKLTRGIVAKLISAIKRKDPSYRYYNRKPQAIFRDKLPQSDWEILDKLYSSRSSMNANEFVSFIQSKQDSAKSKIQLDDDDLLIQALSQQLNIDQVGFWLNTKQLRMNVTNQSNKTTANEQKDIRNNKQISVVKAPKPESKTNQINQQTTEQIKSNISRKLNIEQSIIELGSKLDPKSGRVLYSDRQIATKIGLSQTVVNRMIQQMQKSQPEFRRYSNRSQAIARDRLPVDDWNILDQLFPNFLSNLTVAEVVQYFEQKYKQKLNNNNKTDQLISKLSQRPNSDQIGFWLSTKRLRCMQQSNLMQSSNAQISGAEEKLVDNEDQREQNEIMDKNQNDVSQVNNCETDDLEEKITDKIDSDNDNINNHYIVDQDNIMDTEQDNQDKIINQDIKQNDIIPPIETENELQSADQQIKLTNQNDQMQSAEQLSEILDMKLKLLEKLQEKQIIEAKLSFMKTSSLIKSQQKILKQSQSEDVQEMACQLYKCSECGLHYITQKDIVTHMASHLASDPDNI